MIKICVNKKVGGSQLSEAVYVAAKNLVGIKSRFTGFQIDDLGVRIEQDAHQINFRPYNWETSWFLSSDNFDFDPYIPVIHEFVRQLVLQFTGELVIAGYQVEERVWNIVVDPV